jgi:hypothetical protein
MKQHQKNRLYAAMLTFMLIGCGGGGSSPVTVTPPPVVVTPPAPVATLVFITTTSNGNGVVGTPYTLQWTGTNVSGCTASGAWTGALDGSGAKTLTPTTEGTASHTITCGSTTKTVVLNILPQFTAIPDAAFEAALIGAGVDDVLDGKVSTAKALTITKMAISNEGYLPPGFYDAAGKQIPLTAVFGTGVTPKIKSIVGIEAFANLTMLQIENQQVATIDVSKLVNLIRLSLWQEPITTIDLSKNLKLETLGLSETSLKTVDISMLSALLEIDFQQDTVALPYTLGNGTTVYGFTTVDLTKNSNLARIYIEGNPFTTIDLTGNKKLQEFWADGNKFISLDFRGFNNLNYVVLNNSANLTYLNIADTNNGVVQHRLLTANSPHLTEIHVGTAALVSKYQAAAAAGNQGVLINAAPAPVTNFVL